MQNIELRKALVDIFKNIDKHDIFYDTKVTKGPALNAHSRKEQWCIALRSKDLPPEDVRSVILSELDPALAAVFTQNARIVVSPPTTADDLHETIRIFVDD